MTRSFRCSATEQHAAREPHDSFGAMSSIWRKRVRVEHTLDTAKVPSAGFEDREDHRIPFASASFTHDSRLPHKASGHEKWRCVRSQAPRLTARTAGRR